MIAPDFTLNDQQGKPHTLSSYRGKWALLFFYPKDDTPGCTKEACGIRDQYDAFQIANIEVFGINTDSSKKHDKFISKYQLPFTLLADEEKLVVQSYDVWGPKKFMGREFLGTKRISFLIDPHGKIAKIYLDVAPADHASEVLEDQQSLLPAETGA